MTQTKLALENFTTAGILCYFASHLTLWILKNQKILSTCLTCVLRLIHFFMAFIIPGLGPAGVVSLCVYVRLRCVRLTSSDTSPPGFMDLALWRSNEHRWALSLRVYTSRPADHEG